MLFCRVNDFVMLNVIMLVSSYSKLERIFDYRFQFEPTSSSECTAIYRSLRVSLIYGTTDRGTTEPAEPAEPAEPNKKITYFDRNIYFERIFNKTIVISDKFMNKFMDKTLFPLS